MIKEMLAWKGFLGGIIVVKKLLDLVVLLGNSAKWFSCNSCVRFVIEVFKQDSSCLDQEANTLIT